MFMFNDSETLAWFPSTAKEEDKTNFFLVGVLCGLALYNKSIIHFPFPLALFKKLLDVEPTLEDMMEFSPVVGKSLQYVLDYEDDLENLCLPYSEFKRGFFQVCDRDLVKLFRPEELQQVLVGQDVYDWAKLKQNTEWELRVGYPTMQMFWEVFDELTEDQRKDFLWFLTGFRRVPILGMDQVQMKVQLMQIQGGQHYDQHFPLFSDMSLYSGAALYSSKEIMRDRLTRP
ncbi:hypothetical protein FQN60_016006 [Etheostoma spectabile]|uniref:HECT domain-containing protein n=1 Tax=Etheostoma spectabile TaxID=54343 RepID=A0A5J5C8L2_9PERO|nr:hypothetical protein FQN60_016006 [Etheostoma spectabile]